MAQLKNTSAFINKKKPTDIGNLPLVNTALTAAELLALSQLNASSGAKDNALAAANIARFALNFFSHRKTVSRLAALGYENARIELETMLGYGAGGEVKKNYTLSEQEEKDIKDFFADIPLENFRALSPKTSEITATRGMIVSAEEYLKTNVEDLDEEYRVIFQYNFPQENDTKSNKYEERGYLGHSGSREIFASGGRRKIDFELFFDATSASLSSDRLQNEFSKNLPAPGFTNTGSHDYISVSKENGTLEVISKLQNFSYPLVRRSELDAAGLRARFTNGVFEPAPRFSSPPKLFLVLGRRIYHGWIMSPPAITHELYNEDYIPVRSKAKVEFIVDEWDVHSDAGERIQAWRNVMSSPAEKLPSQEWIANAEINNVAGVPALGGNILPTQVPFIV